MHINPINFIVASPQSLIRLFQVYLQLYLINAF